MGYPASNTVKYSINVSHTLWENIVGREGEFGRMRKRDRMKRTKKRARVDKNV